MLLEETSWRLVEDEVSVAPDRVVTGVVVEHLVDKIKFVGPKLESLDQPDSIAPCVIIFSITGEN